MIRQMVLIDDDLHQRRSATQALELSGYEVESFADPRLAVRRITRGFPGVVISDMRMPGMTGLDVLDSVRRTDDGLPVILMTGYGDVPLAVKAMRAGAFDFIEKPFATDVLVETAKRACETRSLVLENRRLRDALHRQRDEDVFLIGGSDAVTQLKDLIAEMAENRSPVLIQGEPGCEYHVAANTLFRAGMTGETQPFVAIRCDELSEKFAETELFGHRRANGVTHSPGALEKAEGGTLFIERADQLPACVLNKVFTRMTVDKADDKRPRLILSDCGASDDPRLGASFPGVLLKMPPVRKRGQDRLLLFQHFAEIAATRLRRRVPILNDTDISAILGHDWPGNVAQIQAVAERFVLGLGLSDELFDQTTPHDVNDASPLPEQVAGFERALIKGALARSNGSITRAYQELGIPRKTLQDKMKKYRLHRSDFTKPVA